MNLTPHIQEGSYLWADIHISYNKLTEALGSKQVILSSHEENNKVNHISTVNSFHSSIKEWNAKMRGVATKYINRYVAFSNVRWLCRELDDSGSLLKAKKIIKFLGKYNSFNWDEVDNTSFFKGRGSDVLERGEVNKIIIKPTNLDKNWSTKAREN